MSRRAIVLGGGIAGLGAAIGLRQAGYRVDVYEQAAAIKPIGAALSLWPNAVLALRRLGAAAVIEAEAEPISALRLATRRDRTIIGPWSVEAERYGAPAYLPSRALLQQSLHDALGDGVRLHLGDRVDRVEDDEEQALVHFANGRILDADLVVAADGLWSATGNSLIGNPPAARGYGGVLALSDPVQDDAAGGLAVEYLGAGERFGVFDLGGRRRYWFYMASEPLPPVGLDALLARARGWPAPVSEAVRATPAERLIPVTIHARAVPRRLAHGRVICVGDAAHGMEPNLGQGACQALEDAVALADIGGQVAPAQVGAAFDRARHGRVAKMMRRARDGGLAAHGPRLVQPLARTALRLIPSVVHRRMLDWQYRLPAY